MIAVLDCLILAMPALLAAYFIAGELGARRFRRDFARMTYAHRAGMLAGELARNDAALLDRRTTRGLTVRESCDHIGRGTAC